MKITEGDNWAVPAGQTGAVASARGGQATPDKTAEANTDRQADQIAPSAWQAMVDQARSAESEFQQARIERLTQAVRSGSYQIDAMVVGRAIVSEALS